VLENRTNLSSPGEHAGSEPETQAMALIERLRPPLVLDIHSPLELVFPRGDVPTGLVESLSAAAGLPGGRRTRSTVPGSVRRLAHRGRDPRDHL
jgi:hypothetical protein